MKTMRTVLGIFLSVVFIGCASLQSVKPSSSSYDQLRSTVAKYFDDDQFENAHWGVLIKSLKTGEVLYSRNDKKMFMPASNMKLFTSSAATMALAPEYRYYTRVVALGQIRDSILYGDIVLIGSGDPTISGRYNEGKVTETFEQWADSLRARGIKEITGRVIGDDNCFDDEVYGPGWSADYETDYYAAQLGGISFNDNCVDFRIVPSATIADICSVFVVPDTRYVTIVNLTVTAPESDSVNRINFSRVRGTNIVYVRGTMSQGKQPWIESVAIDNPTLYTVTVLKEILESKGLKIHGTAADIDDLKDSLRYDDAQHLASFTSVPYSVIVKTINKPSQNFYTEQVLRTMGKERYGVGSVETGKRVAYPILSRWGVDTIRLRYADGSGLSRLNLITPSDIVSLLEGIHAEEEQYFLPFYESLPIAGVDGSIKNRMKGTKAEGNVHAKTGFIGYVRALSGYVFSRDGELFVFSMIANHYTVPTRLAEKIQNDVCVILAEFKR
jgi:D-alanyl-D-alanine carboxypeptidase/D-alanyl-D-alanine-endopeptidase (penicillin-binding protein 4)